MEKLVKGLEKRIAKLEKAAVLFERHRQSWLDLNKKLKKLKHDMDHESLVESPRR
jgi:hypothetical protein